LAGKEKEKWREGMKGNGNRYDAIGRKKGSEGEEKIKKSFRRSAEGFMRGFLGLGRR
jgi:hypothetical protein